MTDVSRSGLAAIDDLNAHGRELRALVWAVGDRGLRDH
jgi:hypothetical protein